MVCIYSGRLKIPTSYIHNIIMHYVYNVCSMYVYDRLCNRYSFAGDWVEVLLQFFRR